jgi:D-glycero-alpha-D-manno-heptose 1-phosphate guanylyltransferase
LISALPENRSISLEKDLFSTLIGKDFFAFPQETKFIDIGTPHSYKEAGSFFMQIDRFIDPEKSRSNNQ